jgi:hypothetical protein
MFFRRCLGFFVVDIVEQTNQAPSFWVFSELFGELTHYSLDCDHVKNDVLLGDISLNEVKGLCTRYHMLDLGSDRN